LRHAIIATGSLLLYLKNMRVLTFQECFSAEMILHACSLNEAQVAVLYGEWVKIQLTAGKPYFSFLGSHSLLTVTPDYVGGVPIHKVIEGAPERWDVDRAYRIRSVALKLSIESGKTSHSWPLWREALESLMEFIFVNEGAIHRIEVDYRLTDAPAARSFHQQHAIDAAFPGSAGRFVALP
jgi:hypothetical protein